MRRNLLSFNGVLLLLVFVAGCATVQTDGEWSRLNDIVPRDDTTPLVWEENEESRLKTRQLVEERLAQGLTREEAVFVALLNNRELQSRFEEIGISKAELVQAGLPTNPSLSALARFPVSSGSSGGTNLEIGGVFAVSDLWQIPLRKRMAETRLERAVLEVADAARKTTRDAKNAYDQVVYLTQVRVKTAEHRDTLNQMKVEAVRQQAFGYLSDMEASLMAAAAHEADIELAGTEAEMAVARARLALVLGLGDGGVDLALKETMADNLPPLPAESAAVGSALENRLDLKTAELGIEEAERELRLNRVRFLRDVHLGASYERDTGGEKVFGPQVDMQLPLFDQNQAQIARAEYLLRKARKQLAARRAAIREEVAGGLRRARFLRMKARTLAGKVIPLKEKALRYAETWSRAMQLNRLTYLDMQKGLLESRIAYRRAFLDFRHSVNELRVPHRRKVARAYEPSLPHEEPPYSPGAGPRQPVPESNPVRRGPET